MSQRRSTVTGLHAIIGSDSFLAEEALEQLIEDSVGRDAEDAIEMLHGEDVSWARVADAVQSRSLFSEKRAVVVRRADEIKGSTEAFEHCLENPAPDTTLILMAAKPDRRFSVWKKIVEQSKVVSAEPLKGRFLRNFVGERIRRRGIPLSDDGIQELLDRVGADLRRLMGEMDKLAAFAAGGTTRLGGEEVASVLGRGFASPLYKLADAFCERRAPQVVTLTEELLEEGEAPLRILATFHRALRQLCAALELDRNRGSAQDLVTRMGVPAFKTDALLRASRGWTENGLQSALGAFFEADRRLKTGAPPRPVLAAAVLAACGAEAKKPRNRT